MALSNNERPCRLCNRWTDRLERICPRCERAIAMHRATIATAPDQPMDDRTALARFIIQRHLAEAGVNPSPESYSIDFATVAVEIERGTSASAIMLWNSNDFRRYGQKFIDMAENDLDFDGATFHVHHGYDLFRAGRGPSSRNILREGVLPPAAIATWFGYDRRGSCVVRVERRPGAHPADALGENAWIRLASAFDGCGVSLDPIGRALRFEHGTAPDWDVCEGEPLPADLAVVVALLVDAGVVDPAICEDALMSAKVEAEGSLSGHPRGKSGLVHWAVENGWRRLHVAELDAPAFGTTGMEVWGYEHLGDLIDTWRPGRGLHLGTDTEAAQ
jgi:hypothetical protein